MTPIDKLKAAALARRDKIIGDARAEYRETMRQLRTIDRRLKRPARPRRLLRTEGQLTAVAAAEIVLRERGPLTLVEIAMAVQAMGVRAGDDPQVLLNNLRASFRYHEGRFVRGKDGRWNSIHC